MNIAYWMIVVVLLAIAFAMIIPPLWKKREIQDAEADQRNIHIAKERARELKLQLGAGELSQYQFDEQQAELELTLGDDLDIEKSVDSSVSQGKWAVFVIALCVPLFSVLMYFSLGEPDALIKAEMKQAENSAPDINSMVMGLAKRLKENPGNAKDWQMLGRSFKYLKQYKLAANAFAKAYELVGDEPDLMLQYADALIMAKGGTLVGKPTELIFKALEKSPNNITGLWLAGMAKAEQQEFTQAISLWRKLESVIPAGDTESYQQVQSLIASVQGKVNGATEIKQPKQVIAEPATEAIISVNVQVSITEEVKAQVNENDTVFIYAKALTGPPMPLAIIRKQVKDLPLSVELNDSMAMMPAMKLSNFKAVQVVARVSKSGTAMQQKGDYLGSIDINKLQGKSSVKIDINREIK